MDLADGALFGAIGTLAATVALLFRELRRSDRERLAFVEAQLAARDKRDERLSAILDKLLLLAEAQAQKPRGGGFR